mgnify:CR=1 FL=1
MFYLQIIHNCGFRFMAGALLIGMGTGEGVGVGHMLFFVVAKI